MHGGKSPVAGPTHPTYKHGGFSKAFGRLSEMVEAAMEDPQLLDPRRGIAAALAGLEEAGARLDLADTPSFRKRAAELFGRAMLALGDEDRHDEAIKMLEELGALLRRGVTHDVAFRDVVSRAETYRTAVNDGIKLQLAAQNSMSLTELIGALDQLVGMVIEVCGAEKGAEVAHRFDHERFGGRLAKGGMLLGARTVKVEESDGK